MTETMDSSASVSFVRRLGTFVIVVVPFVGLLTAIILLWGRGISWIELGVLALMYVATGFGVTLGFHRLFTHQSFRTVRPVELALAIMGSMSAQGPLFEWTAVHRRHHQHSDEDGDPHSPNCHGDGFWGVLKGAWHAHVGWMFTSPTPSIDRYVPDLYADPALRFINNTFLFWVAIGLLIPTALGFLLTGTWLGALLGFIWGGLVRICVVHHLTWSINSVCHLWGQRPFRSHDDSRNNFIFGVLAFGEGWHNNHHAFPTSARHGLSWAQLDITYLVILLLKAFGLAWSVRLPSPEAIAARRVHVHVDETLPAAPPELSR